MWLIALNLGLSLLFMTESLTARPGGIPAETMTLKELRDLDPFNCNGWLGTIAGFQNREARPKKVADFIMGLAAASKDVHSRDNTSFDRFGPQRARPAARNVSVQYRGRFGVDPLNPDPEAIESMSAALDNNRVDWIQKQRDSVDNLPHYKADEGSWGKPEVNSSNAPSLTTTMAPDAVRTLQIDGEDKLFRAFDVEFPTGIDLSEPIQNKIFKLVIAREVQDRFFPDEKNLFPEIEVAVVDGQIGLLIDKIDSRQRDSEIVTADLEPSEINRMRAYIALVGAFDTVENHNFLVTSENRLVHYDPQSAFDPRFNFLDERTDNHDNELFGSHLPDEYPDGFEGQLKRMIAEIKGGAHQDLPDVVRYRLLFGAEILLEDMSIRGLSAERQSQNSED